ncbi:MAG: NAD(+)/NADH kinase [Lachnospiraceae bacterium]|nr:NAD(+)/NADH kinase [Lachnospiraceae bacterium]
MNRFAIITNPEKDLGGETAGYICRYLFSNGKSCEIVGGREGKKQIPPDTECLLVIGGDGTMIQAARDWNDSRIPLIGINMGTLGYLAEIDLPSLTDALNRLMAETPMVEDRMMLKGDILRNGRVICRDIALNDIVLGRGNSLNVICFTVEVDGEILKKYAADGMIVATPTGSTAYNLSAGGPIVAPAASLILMTPISPHTMINRSIVLPDTARIGIELTPRKDRELAAIVGFDGKGEVPLRAGDRIEISRSERVTKIFKLSRISFLENLRDKMQES